ncbi:IS200/IS605 family transposase [Salinimicrobium catena]|nr:IS200/IS605 family transposase [Salinimicrobium catena]
MPNTYTQIHIQFIFAVKYRESLIKQEWKDRLYQYITGIVQRNGHKMIIINGMADHLHILVGMRPNQSISDLLQDIKGSSSKWINEQKLTNKKFAWQEGYGAFSYSKQQIPRIISYIANQEEHHLKRSFRKEYLRFLQENSIEYDERYIFNDPE